MASGKKSWIVLQVEFTITGSSGNTSCRSPLFINSRHDVEGYAISWNPYTLGILVSGDCNGEIYLWSPIHGGWELNRFYKTNASIEDVKWQDSNIFSSSSTDGIIRLFDLRCKGVTCEFKVSNVDVNSISWNPIEKNILLCGDDEGIGKIYDIRHIDNNLAEITWHNNSIISLDWHPNESSVLALCSRDDSISIWDTSIEAQDITNNPNIPQQLMFLHMGQTDITQVMFHQQIPGVIISTALDGLNVFKPINI